MRLNKIITSILFAGIALPTFAQQINADSTRIERQVQVVKAYQPSISDAYKLSEMPVIKDSTAFNPDFKYHISSAPFATKSQAGTITPAKSEGSTEINEGIGYVKAGLGNYLTPYGELFLNKAEKDYSLGLHFNHLSSDGKVKLSNNEKVEAPFSNNELNLFGNKQFKKGKLSVNLSYKRDAFNYYGAPKLLLENETYHSKRDFSSSPEQVLNKIGLQTNYSGTYKKDINYTLGLDYHHFKTKTNQAENLAALTGKLNKEYKKFNARLTSKIQYYNVDNIVNYSSQSGKRQNILIEAAPSALFNNKTWSLETGFTTDLLIDDDDDAKFYIYPKINFEWKTIDDILTTFAGINGHFQHNTYSRIAYDNQFVNSTHDVKNTNHQLTTTLGVRGKFSSKINFKAQGTYDIVKDMHFYYWSDTNPDVQFFAPSFSNTEFSHAVTNDDMNGMNLRGEIQYIEKDFLSVFLTGNWYNYQMDKLNEPLHKQKWDVTITSKAKVMERLSLNGELFVIGKRKGLVELTPFIGTEILNIETLKAITDLNIGAEYELPYNINAFVKINNLLGQNYQKMIGYNAYGTRLMLGASWQF